MKKILGSFFALFFCFISAEAAVVLTKDAYGWTNVHKAAKEGDLKKLKSLGRLTRSDILSPDIIGLTPVHLSVIGGNLDLFILLIKVGGLKYEDIMQKDKYDRTIIHFIVMGEHLGILKFVLGLEELTYEDILAQDDEDNNAFDLAQNREMKRLLREHLKTIKQ